MKKRISVPNSTKWIEKAHRRLGIHSDYTGRFYRKSDNAYMGYKIHSDKRLVFVFDTI